MSCQALRHIEQNDELIEGEENIENIAESTHNKTISTPNK